MKNEKQTVKKNSIVKRLVFQTIGHEKRQKYMIPVFSILLSLIAGMVVIALLGKNPFQAYFNLLQGSVWRRRLPMQGTKE